MKRGAISIVEVDPAIFYEEKKMDNAEIEKLEEFEEKTKHGISPCDEESGNYSVIKLNRKDAENLRELLTFVLKQLEK